MIIDVQNINDLKAKQTAKILYWKGCIIIMTKNARNNIFQQIGIG